MYAQWRYRGLDPYVVLRGSHASPPDGGRHEAVLTAFAIKAAENEGAAADFVRSFSEGMAGG